MIDQQIADTMNFDFPNDSDGEALRRIAEDGSDMSKPMSIDFHVAAPSKTDAELIAATVTKHDYEASISFDEETAAWTVWCSRDMIATHKNVVEAQSQLDELSKPFDGYSDGWGSFGNVESDTEKA